MSFLLRSATATRILSPSLALILTACATHTIGGAAATVRSWDIDAPFDAVWEATLTALSEAGFEVSEAARAAGTIDTVPKIVAEGSGFSDCDGPYSVQLRLTVDEGVTGTRLGIDPSFTTGDGPESGSCATTGGLERTLSRRVIEITR